MELKSQFMMNIKDGAKAGRTPQPDPTLCPEPPNPTCPPPLEPTDAPLMEPEPTCPPPDNNQSSLFMEDRNNDGAYDKKTHKYYMEAPPCPPDDPEIEIELTAVYDEYITTMYDDDFNGIFEYETRTENGIIDYEARYDNETGEKIEDKIYGSDGDLLYTRQFEYDENGNESKTIEYNPDGSIDRVIDYKYDENGDYIGHVWVDDEGETVGYMKTFDENGKQIGEIWDQGDYGFTYLTDENGNYLEDENGHWIRIETGDIPHPTEGITTAGNMKANLNPVAKDQLHLK